MTITWPDNAIAEDWLQVTVNATATTGLTTPDVFYYGNAIGESGDSTLNAFVNASDEIAVRHQTAVAVSVASPYDIDRNGTVDANDELIVHNNRTGFLSG